MDGNLGWGASGALPSGSEHGHRDLAAESGSQEV
jgi:hypothetical protein